MIKQHEYLLLDNCWRIDINAFSQLISDGQELLWEAEGGD